MASSNTIVGFPSEDAYRRALEQLRRMRGTPSRGSGQRRQSPILGGSSGGAGSGASSGTTCCCDESKCLKIPGIDIPITPAYYEIQLPSSFLCGCNPTSAEAGKIQLYQSDAVDDTIWESAKIKCMADIPTYESCTQTGYWMWIVPLADECTGTGCVWTFSPDGSGQWRVTTFDCQFCAGCVSPEGGFPTDPVPGQTVSGEGCVPFPEVDPPPPYWQLQGVEDEECDCVPDEPDFDGSSHGQEAETTCESTKIVGATEDLVDTWWRLTIVEELSYYGCDDTVLEFIQDEGPIVQYHLQRQCGNSRPFCRQCVNTFAITTCGPTKCDTQPPGLLCLEPKIPTSYPCNIMQCGDTPKVLRIANFELENSAPNSWAATEGGLAAINAVWAKDYYLYSGVPNEDGVSCSWRANFVPIFRGSEGDYGSCGEETVTADRYLVGSITVVLYPDGITGVQWSIRLFIGYAAYANEAFSPCFVDGQLVTNGSYLDSYATDGGDPEFITQDPIECESFDLPIWAGVVLPVSLEILDAEP